MSWLSQALPGLVLRLRFGGLSEERRDRDRVLLRVGAGESWPALVRHCLRAGYYGFGELGGHTGQRRCRAGAKHRGLRH